FLHFTAGLAVIEVIHCWLSAPSADQSRLLSSHWLRHARVPPGLYGEYHLRRPTQKFPSSQKLRRELFPLALLLFIFPLAVTVIDNVLLSDDLDCGDLHFWQILLPTL